MERVNGYKLLKHELKKARMVRDMLSHSNPIQQAQMNQSYSTIEKLLK